MHRKIGAALLLGAALMTGCGKSIPGEIIQPAEMEEILYDYHLGSSMSGSLSYSKSYEKEAFNKYVFQKHRVTQAEFDSSLVWYTRHAAELAKIYTRLGTRFKDGKKQINAVLALRDNKPDVSLPGDTVDIWPRRSLYRLAGVPLANRLAFDVPSDSNFRERDAFLWSARYTFLSPDTVPVTMGFNILFDNDSVVGCTLPVRSSGVHELYLRTDSGYAIKGVGGFVYLPGQDTCRQAEVLVSHIRLVRYHEPVDTVAVPVAPSDSLPSDLPEADTLARHRGDTLPSVTPDRRNPRAVRDGHAARPLSPRLQQEHE